MKNFSFALLLLGLMLSGCGQPGPLYLPGTKPPFYVPPEPEPEAKGKEADKDNNKEQAQDKVNAPDENATETEESPKSQPVPDNKPKALKQ
jgi:predicted small lipoprotein YifL